MCRAFVVLTGVTVFDKNLVRVILSSFNSWFLLVNASVYVIGTLVDYSKANSGKPNEGWIHVLNFAGHFIWMIGTVWMLLWDAIITPGWRHHWVQVCDTQSNWSYAYACGLIIKVCLHAYVPRRLVWDLC